MLECFPLFPSFQNELIHYPLIMTNCLWALKINSWNPLEAQWLGRGAFTALQGFISGGGTKIPEVAWGDK